MRFLLRVITLLFLMHSSLLAQERFDFGLFGGTSSYLGDINPYRPLYAPRLSYGGIINYTLSSRYLIRTEIYKGNISGSDKDFPTSFERSIRNISFAASFIDLSMQLEFNFLPYVNITKFKDNYSFFVTAGAGYSFITKSTFDANGHFNIPFGCGIKYTLVKRLTVGLEWTMRKTFLDKVDGVINWQDKFYKSNIHNKDWYSFGGIYFTYKLFYPEGNCPAYWDRNE